MTRENVTITTKSWVFDIAGFIISIVRLLALYAIPIVAVTLIVKWVWSW